MNTMHLIGSEQVQSAGVSIGRAADTINSAASTIDDAARRMTSQLETHGYQMEALATAMASAPTLHDYFMAHAPVEPHDWFEPVTAMPRPEAPPYLDRKTLSPAEKAELDDWQEMICTVDLQQPRIRAHCEARDAYGKAEQAWNREAKKQRSVQWPAAWADAMMKAREA